MRVTTKDGQGTGFIISDDGLVITANHVVEWVSSAEVMLYDGRKLTGSVVGRDLGADVAVLSLGQTGLPSITLGNSDNLKIGDTVIKIGYSIGLVGDPTAATGTVSAFRNDDRFNTKYVQTDAPLNPGDSGGVLLDRAGEVVGIITAKYVGVSVEGLGFGVAVNDVKGNMSRLSQGEVICPPIPNTQEGTTITSPRYGYKVTVPKGAKWEHTFADDGILYVGRADDVVPGNRRARQYSSGVNIWVTLRNPDGIQAYQSDWTKYFESVFATVNVLSIRPVCVPSLGVTDALEAEVEVVTQSGLAPDRERWVAFFHGAVAYFMEGYEWDTRWETTEQYIDSLMYSIHFD